MVYWCTPIGITLQRSISYTLASFVRNCLLHILSKHMCKATIQTLSTYVGGAIATIWSSWNLSISFTHGKYAWASNMDSIKFQLISLWKGCHQLPKRRRLKALVWFWLIDETLSANLVYQDDYEIGSTTPSDEAMAKIMTTMMAWWWSNA